MGNPSQNGAQSPSQLRSQIKELIVRELNLEGKDPGTIVDDAPLFGEGLGLDSLDALQLAMSIEERFGVRIPEGDEARPIFRSVATLAEYIANPTAIPLVPAVADAASQS